SWPTKNSGRLRVIIDIVRASIGSVSSPLSTYQRHGLALLQLGLLDSPALSRALRRYKSVDHASLRRSRLSFLPHLEIPDLLCPLCEQEHCEQDSVFVNLILQKYH